LVMALLFASPSLAQSAPGLPQSAIANPYLFQGARYDAETGYYYFRNRYYDPRAGRFLQRDPVWDPANMGNAYTFAASSPLAFGDPLGLNGDPISGPFTEWQNRSLAEGQLWQWMQVARKLGDTYLETIFQQMLSAYGCLVFQEMKQREQEESGTGQMWGEGSVGYRQAMTTGKALVERAARQETRRKELMMAHQTFVTTIVVLGAAGGAPVPIRLQPAGGAGTRTGPTIQEVAQQLKNVRREARLERSVKDLLTEKSAREAAEMAREPSPTSWSFDVGTVEGRAAFDAFARKYLGIPIPESLPVGKGCRGAGQWPTLLDRPRPASSGGFDPLPPAKYKVVEAPTPDWEPGMGPIPLD
jgi:RHS repeat-associated protein